MSFVMLPPEINSGRMYAGPGAGPMSAAAAAWDNLAGELYSTAASYAAEISELTDDLWAGPSATAMANAAAPQVGWLTSTATLAEQAASQARAAVSAYEAAFAMTVPPPVIAANRAEYMRLVITNLFGQNAPAIAAAEAHYAEMWAQDAAAMNGYAAASSVHSTLTPFTTPPRSTTANAQGIQAAAVAHAAATSGTDTLLTGQHILSAGPQALQALGSPQPGQSALLASIINEIYQLQIPDFLSPLSGDAAFPGETAFAQVVGMEMFYAMSHSIYSVQKSMMGVGLVPSTLEGIEIGSFAPLAGAPTGATASVTTASAAMSVGIGNSNMVGGLSVPRGWTTAAPAMHLAATALPFTSFAIGPETGVLAGMPALGVTPLLTTIGNGSHDEEDDEDPSDDDKKSSSKQIPGRRSRRYV